MFQLSAEDSRKFRYIGRRKSPGRGRHDSQTACWRERLRELRKRAQARRPAFQVGRCSVADGKRPVRDGCGGGSGVPVWSEGGGSVAVQPLLKGASGFLLNQKFGEDFPLLRLEYLLLFH